MIKSLRFAMLVIIGLVGNLSAEARATPLSKPTATSDAERKNLHRLERGVSALKEQLSNTHKRLKSYLEGTETVLGCTGSCYSGRLQIRHQNDMGSTFRLAKLYYAVDGALIYSSSNAKAGRHSFDVFKGSIVPGKHSIDIKMVFKGHGWGVLSYIEGYTVTVRAKHIVTIGKLRQRIVVRVFEQGDATTQWKNRPAIEFHTTNSERKKSAR